MPDRPFTLAYLSNVLDWTRDKAGENLNLGEKRIREVLEPVMEKIDSNGQIIFNFQWHDRALRGSRRALKHFGYSLRRLSQDCPGCGYMYIAEKSTAQSTTGPQETHSPDEKPIQQVETPLIKKESKLELINYDTGILPNKKIGYGNFLPYGSGKDLTMKVQGLLQNPIYGKVL